MNNSEVHSIILLALATLQLAVLPFLMLRTARAPLRETQLLLGAITTAAAWTAISAHIIAADNPADLFVPQRIRMACMHGFCYFLVTYATVQARRTPKGYSLYIAFTVFCAVYITSGLALDPAMVQSWRGQTPTLEVVPPLFGVLIVFGIFMQYYFAYWMMRSDSIRHRDARLLASCFLCLGTSWILDIVVSIIDPMSALFSDYSATICVAIIGVHRVLASVDHARALARKTSQLVRELETREKLELELLEVEPKAAVGVASALLAEELRAPLGALSEAVDALHQTRDPLEFQRALDRIDEENENMNALVGDLYTYARLPEPSFERLSARECWSEVVEMISRRGSDIPLVSFEEDDMTLRADRILVVSAVFHQVWFVLGSDHDVEINVRFSIGDDGVFVSAKRAKGQPSGSQLSAAVAERLAEAHHGSAVLEGESYILFFPDAPPRPSYESMPSRR